MNQAIELHDSTLADVMAGEGVVVVRLAPAHVHRSEARPGLDPGTVWLQDVELRFQGGNVDGPVPKTTGCWLWEGRLKVGDEEWRLIPLPFKRCGDAFFESTTEEGEKLVVRGDGVEVVACGEAKYLEEFA